MKKLSHLARKAVIFQYLRSLQ